MIKIRGYRLLVEPKEVETVSKGGIIVTVEGTKEEKLEKHGNQFGYVRGIGETCWKGQAFEDNWCEVGDLILFARHSGRFVYDPTIEDSAEDELMVINDTDVIAVIETGE